MCGFFNIIFGYLYILNSMNIQNLCMYYNKKHTEPLFSLGKLTGILCLFNSLKRILTPVYMIYLYYESKFHYNPSLKQDLLYCVVCNFYLFLVIHYTYHFSSQSQWTILCFRMYVVKCPLFILRVGVW